MVLEARLLDGLTRLGCDVRGIVDPERMAERCPTIGFSIAERRPEQVVNALLERGIVTWSGHFACDELMRSVDAEAGGLVRTGIALYRTVDEVDALLDGIRSVAA